MKLGLISDLHYGFPEEKDMEEYLKPVAEGMVQEINEFDPDIVISLGDFIQHSNREEDLDKLEKVGEIFEDVEEELYGIPGNHDHITVSKDEALDKVNVENEETYFSLEVNGYKLIFIDTIAHIDDVYGAGLIGSEQRKWLKDEMKTEKEVLIFSHHLLHNRDLEGNWYFDENPELAACIDKNQFFDIAGDRPEAVFSAHIHEADVEEVNGTPHFTTPGMDKYNPPEKFKKNHALIEIDDEEISFETPEKSIRYKR